MPDVKINLNQAIDIAHKDSEIQIDGLGRLKFSKGSVEWLGWKKSVQHYSLTWEELAELFKEHGTEIRKTKKPA